MTKPLLLLAPDGSTTRDGPYTPTIEGGTLLLDDGQYGSAYLLDGRSRIEATAPVAASGSVVFRCYASGDTGRTLRVVVTTAEGSILLTTPMLSDQWLTLGVSWDAGHVILYRNGVTADTEPLAGAVTGVRIDQGAQGTAYTTRIEALLVYDTALSPVAMANLAEQGSAWRWSQFSSQVLGGIIRTSPSTLPAILRAASADPLALLRHAGAEALALARTTPTTHPQLARTGSPSPTALRTPSADPTTSRTTSDGVLRGVRTDS